MFDPNRKYTALTGDASTRRYWRIDGEKKILCHDPNQLSQSEFLSIAEVFKDNGVCAPEVFDIDKQKQSYIQSDLGDTTLLIDLVVNKSCELERYKSVIDELLKIQQINNIPDFVRNRFFDQEKFNFEIDMTLNYFGEQLLGASKDHVNRTRDQYSKIINELCCGDKVFVHRDYHSRNIMVFDQKVYIIDFQDARMGVPHYDLASVLDDCYYQVESVNKEKLLKYYYEKALELGIIKSNYKDFLTKYQMMVMQRVFKAIGSFAYIYKDKSNPRYLKYIGFAVEKLRLLSQSSKQSLNIDIKIFEDYYAN